MACERGGDQGVGVGVSRRLTHPEPPQALRNSSGPLRVPYPAEPPATLSTPSLRSTSQAPFQPLRNPPTLSRSPRSLSSPSTPQMSPAALSTPQPLSAPQTPQEPLPAPAQPLRPLSSGSPSRSRPRCPGTAALHAGSCSPHLRPLGWGCRDCSSQHALRDAETGARESQQIGRAHV